MKLEHVPHHAWTAEFARNVVKAQISGMIFYGVITERWVDSRENRYRDHYRCGGFPRYIVQIMNSQLLMRKDQFTFLDGEELPNVYVIRDNAISRSTWLLHPTMRDLAKRCLVLDGSQKMSKYRASSAATPEGTRRLRFEMR